MRLGYADWLEERGDPRAKYLRLDREGERINFVAWLEKNGRKVDYYVERDPTVEGLRKEHEKRKLLRTQLQALPERIDPEWLAFMNTLDGAASCPVHPFVCELKTDRPKLTGADVLAALNVRAFRSEHIADLEVTYIPYPGYHPGTDNDELHNDVASQCLFQRPGDDEEEEDWPEAKTSRDSHEALKQYLGGERLWYVLLHPGLPGASTDDRKNSCVVLFAVGRSPHGKRLLGVVSHQVCHNLCD